MRIEIYLPSKDKFGKNIADREQLLFPLIKEIITISGGATIDNQASGYYVADNGDIITENVNRLWAEMPTRTFWRNRMKVYSIISKIQKTMNQESVAYRIANGNLRFFRNGKGS